ncbi:MAG TPA: ComEC/Rec2 family competence protein, partial [Nitriliruptoraceae bacterium]|nr:ComEC/Rec2 family competence protein [Nitriliruptoraceae bacterium]
AVVALHPSVAEVAAPPQGVLGAVEEVRSRIRAAARVGLAGDAAGLAVGLVTGDTRLLSHAGQDAMQATGLTHLVAVSGSNVALVAGVVAGLAGAAPARLRRAAVLGSILVFAITTRAEPSVLRAAVMAVVVMGATMVGRPRAALHALAVAVIVLLVADPAAAGSLGLALSALATLGVLVVAPVFVLRLPAWLPRPVALLLAATLGAQVAVAPVLVAGIGDVPLAAIPANMVAVPAAAVASLVAVVAALVAQVHQGIGGAIMAVAGPPLHIVLTVARRGDVGPVLSLASPVGLAVATAATVAVLARPRTRLRRSAVVVVGVVAAVTLAPGPGSPGAPPGVLAVTAIDVGQGDALLVTTASGHRMLVDTGRDARAAQWLRRNGVTGLDLVVITHADDDHAGGLDDVLATVEVPVVWVSARPDGSPDPPGDDLPPGTVAVVATSSAVLGSARVDVLGPPAGHDLVATEGGRNDRSVVLRIVEGDRVALLPGDIEHAAQRWLLRSGADVATGMLAVPHHGAATSDPAFLEATGAVVAVVSVGADNDYGHPRQTVLDVLDDMGTTLHRTDLDGTVTVPVPPPR